MQGREQPFFLFFFFFLSLFFAKKTKQTCCNTAFRVCVYVRMRVHAKGAKKFSCAAFFLKSLIPFKLFVI